MTDGEPKLTFLSHFLELRRRLIKSAIAVAIGFIISFIFYEWIFYILEYPAANTPFIVNWPGVVPAGGAVNETSAHLVDIMATLVEISGATYPDASRGEKVGEMDGISLLPAFKNGTVGRNKPIFFEWQNGKAVIDGNWKLVIQTYRPKDEATGLWDFSSQEWELYDLSKDKTEINNLAASNPEKLAEMIGKYDAWWAGVEPGIVYPEK